MQPNIFAETRTLASQSLGTVYGISEHNFTVQNLESKEPLVQCRVSVRTFVALQLSGQTENCD